ncbi:hypothetical protein ACFV80_43265, partial [Streptomyces sp. NPDC059862]|uniref:hypothetical protein n=1 Tax=Streptomyces sp. NPDC059862 TaxID=3346975 RepID=UPI0036519B46
RVVLHRHRRSSRFLRIKQIQYQRVHHSGGGPDTPGPVRWVAYVCLPLGAVTLVLGVYGDGHHWWDNHSFLTNLVSSVTSLLFGVPTALFVLSSLGDAQTQARERRRLRTAVKPEIRQFESLITRRFNVSSASELQQRCHGLLRDYIQARGRDEDVGPYTQRWEELVLRRDEQGQALRMEEQERFHGAWLREVQAQWEFLDNDLRPRALEAGTEWVPAVWSRHVREYLTNLADPDRSASLIEHCEGVEQLVVVVHRLNELYM